MEQLTQAVLQALQTAGIRARCALPNSPMPRPEAAICAVSLQSAAGERYQYLGIYNDGENGERELYGRHTQVQIRIEVFSPVALGGAGCSAEAERVAAVLNAGIAGITVTGYSVGACGYQPVSDYFVCTLTVQCAAYLYATPDADGVTFTDFLLRGEIA